MARFDYPEAFEIHWGIHPHGVKLQAYKEWLKGEFTDAENAMITANLKKRWMDDQKWVSGEYILHLRTYYSQRRWEETSYKRVPSRTPRNYDVEAPQESGPVQRTEAIARAALARIRGELH